MYGIKKLHSSNIYLIILNLKLYLKQDRYTKIVKFN